MSVPLPTPEGPHNTTICEPDAAMLQYILGGLLRVLRFIKILDLVFAFLPCVSPPIRGRQFHLGH